MDGNLESKIMEKINNWIDGDTAQLNIDGWIEKYDPHTGVKISVFADSNVTDLQLAVQSARSAFGHWSTLQPPARGKILLDFVEKLKLNTDTLAECVAMETGKPPGDAKGEVSAAISQGEFFAGEGMRLFGRTLPSAMHGKSSHTIRQAKGVAGLIVPANTPIANLAWKVFPALICGNTCVVKASEDAPKTALLFAKLASEAGLPDGCLNVLQGHGTTVGAELVAHEDVDVISFTGSTQVGKLVAEVAGKRLATVSLELGGKNPFVVCDDANLEEAVHWASLSCFSNAGQRCASASRVLVMPQIFSTFIERFKEKAISLRLGVSEGCDLGPVINAKQRDRIVEQIENALRSGGEAITGSYFANEPELARGYYLRPTIISGLEADAEMNRNEIFGPVATVQMVQDLETAVRIANTSDYGLTSSIHTKDIDKAMWFAKKINAGVANINMGTYGSEPHMPFGGFGSSGNGTREPGTEALDVYSELKNISILTREHLV
jgi:aldehyde dehydrogenase (NAD+)